MLTQAPIYRAHELSSRSIDEKKRSATFVAATEIGVRGWRGPEWLRMGGVDLARFKKNPVILDTHSRHDSGSVIGRASVKVEGKQLVAEVEFATTDRAQEIWELVRTGFLRAVSVGFMPTKWRELEHNETDGEGEDKRIGPGVVIHEWELLEISTVPIPADEDALLRRSFFSPAPIKRRAHMSSIYEEGAGTEKPAPETRTVATPPVVTQPAQTGIESLKRDILALAPTSLREFAEGLVLQSDMDVSKARAALLAEWQKRNAPVGTPEAPKPEAKKNTPEVTRDELVRSLKSLRS